MTSSARDLEIISHYNEYFGEEKRAIRFGERPKPAPSAITVLEFAAQSSESAWVYVTIGASHEPQPMPPEQVIVDLERAQAGSATSGPYRERRIELVLLSTEPNDDLVDLLESLAVYPFVTGGFFGSGHIVGGTPGVGVVKGSPMTEILLGYPHFYPPEFETIEHAEGSHTHLLWVVPIHRSERVYIREHGYWAFEELLGKKEVDTGDLWREPVV